MSFNKGWKVFKDENGCVTGVAMAVCLVGPDGQPIDISTLGGGGGADLEVVCDADGNQIFIKVVRDEVGICTYINPATDEELTPGVGFFPCPDKTDLLLVAIQELTDCLCGECPDGMIDICETTEE